MKFVFLAVFLAQLLDLGTFIQAILVRHVPIGAEYNPLGAFIYIHGGFIGIILAKMFIVFLLCSLLLWFHNAKRNLIIPTLVATLPSLLGVFGNITA